MKGRKPKPTALKILNGNPGCRKLNNDPKVSMELPDCPEYLGPEAREEWFRVAEDLNGKGILARVDQQALACYCQACGWNKEAERRIQAEGPVDVNEKGEVVWVVGDHERKEPPPGSIPYGVPDVPNVIYVNLDAEALHGAYWHNNFGQRMSHGCINLPLPVAEFLYGWAPLGIPVTVY